MSYLFSFQGRINRAKIWLFILVTIAWEIAILLVAMSGLRWTHYFNAIQVMTERAKEGYQPAIVPMPWPDPLGGAGWVAAFVIVLLIALYFVAMLAIYTKRLHDRNKSAWWLLPFVFVPWALNAFYFTSVFGGVTLYGPMAMGWGTAHLIAFILGMWAFIELFFFRGTYGENRFGHDPLGNEPRTFKT